MDFINSALPGLSAPSYSPYAGPVNSAAMLRMEGPGGPEEMASGGLGLEAPLARIMGVLVGLLGSLLMGAQGQGAQGDTSGGGGSGTVNGEATDLASGTSGNGGTTPVNSSSLTSNSGQNVAPNATGTAFPVVGYKGKVELHHGSSHGGADLMAPRGTPIVAMRGGTVESVGSGGAGGNSVTIKGEDGLSYYYAHMDQAPAVSKGQQVRAGQQIGVVGDSGNAKGTGTHLHLGIGHGILNGTGPDGGTGGNFDATSYLQASLAAQRG